VKGTVPGHESVDREGAGARRYRGDDRHSCAARPPELFPLTRPAYGPLAIPAQFLLQDPPHVPGVIINPKLFPNHVRDSVQGPQAVGKPGLLGSGSLFLA